MKKDTSNFIDLDDVFNKSSNSNQKILSENAVITETAEVSKPLPNIESILLEWSWRCDKGYPDINNLSDKIKLQEVLDEMGIQLPFERIVEAPKTDKSQSNISNYNQYPKILITELTKANKLQKFEEFIRSLPGGGVPEVVLRGISDICKSKESTVKLVAVFKQYTDLASLTKINPSEGIYNELFKIQPKGTGPGEILIAWCIDGAYVQGGTVSYDIDYNGQHWEVKSLISTKGNLPEPIDPAKYGKINNFKFSRELQLFFETLVDPYYNNKLRDSITLLTTDDKVKSKLSQILDIFETIPSTTADGSTLLSTSIGEMPPSIFNKFYNAITEIHKLLPKSVTDTAKASRISVKSSTTDAQYWIEPEDVDDITKNAGKDKEISIKVGSKITDEGKEAKIWLSTLLNNKFIKSPKYFVNTLASIRDGFGANKQGIIYLTMNKFNLSFGMDDFFTSGITRSTYRFSLKNQTRYSNYKYSLEQ